MNYCQTIINKYKDKQGLIQSNLTTLNLFPNRNEPLKFLSLKEEAILKATFCIRVAFLNEFEYLFSYCFSKNTFEQTIIKLESQGYITSNTSKEYGKYWILTKQALYYIYDRKNPFNLSSFSEDKFPAASKLAYHKCLNSYICNNVFRNMTYTLYNEYTSLDKAERNKYTKEQFLKYIVYDKRYSKNDMDDFVRMSLNQIEEDETLKLQYREFIKYFKVNIENPTLLFNYLKDLYSSGTFAKYKEQAPEWTLLELNRFTDNALRNHSVKFRAELISQNPLCQTVVTQDNALFVCDEILKQFTIHRRCLLNTKSSNLSNDEQAVLLDNVATLDKGIKELGCKKATLEEQFTLMLFDHFDEETPVYKEATITFESLRQECVVLGDVIDGNNEKPTLRFLIIKPNNELISYSFIAARIAKIHMFCTKTLFGSFNYDIQILVFSNDERLLVQEMLKTLKNEFQAIREYRSVSFNQIQVISNDHRFEERYEVFAAIRPLFMNKHY